MDFVYPLQPDPDMAASPVVGWCHDDRQAKIFPAHSHRRGQLLHVTCDVMAISVDDSILIVPPHRAVWIPGGVEHAVRYPRGVALRSLYLDVAALGVALPHRPLVLQLDPLGRELLKAAAELPWHAALDGAGRRLVTTLLDRLTMVPQGALHVPGGRDRRLIRVMKHLQASPGDKRSIAELAAIANCSTRTLARLFLQDTGMSAGAWREQLRLQIALERLAVGMSVTEIAVDLGYGTPSNFSTMFRRALGVPPSRYFSAGT